MLASESTDGKTFTRANLTDDPENLKPTEDATLQEVVDDVAVFDPASKRGPLEQYAAATDSIRLVKKGSQQVVAAKIVAALSKPFGAIR